MQTLRLKQAAARNLAFDQPVAFKFTSEIEAVSIIQFCGYLMRMYNNICEREKKGKVTRIHML